MKELEDLIRILKGYQKQGLDLKAANKKLYDEEDIVLMELIKNIDEKDKRDLNTFIEFLEKKEPGQRFRNAVDTFAKDLDEQMKRTHKL